MSFGGGFGGFGQQNQTQQTGGFGGFGSTSNTTTGGFGTNTNSFGGATQNTGTGLFGNTGATGGGFGSSTGGFGSTGTGGFGAKPAFGATTSAGGGLFGSTTATAGSSGFGGGGGFGNPAATSSPFGAGGGTSLFGSTAAKPAFGSTTGTGGLFGTTPAASTTSSFGSGTTAGFGATANPGIGTNVGDPPGTNSVAFQPYIEKEATTNQQNSFQNILFMDAYKKWSPEELRLTDYNQGRRYGNATGTGAFGVGSNFGGFGASTTPSTTGTTGGLFGGGGTTTGGFGAQTGTTTGGFGSTSTGGGLFGAKPATTGGLFGSTTPAQPAQTGGIFGGGGTTGGFGSSTTAGGFGSTPAGGTGSLFGSTATQNKPAGGFGFGSTTQGTTGFGATGGTSAFGTPQAATTTGGGLFGSTPAASTTSGGGLFGGGGQTGAASSGFGTQAASGFGAQQQTGGGLFGQAKPATGGLFGSTPTPAAGTGTTGGSLFGSSTTSTPFGGTAGTQQTGGLFGAKPATTTTGGLFGSTPAASTTTGGGLFGGIGQTAQTQQQPAQTGSLFGSSLGQAQQKPSLFGTAAPATGGGLFGGQQNPQQQQGGLFGQSTTAAQPQAGGLGGSLFGNAQQGNPGLGASQGLTTSINDTGAYGAPSLFQSLAAQEVQNPGPLATPLSVNKTKTSRRSSILPLYKMTPGSASKFATPQKRGYGFSYSTFGTPSSVSSTASTPGTMSQSLLVGSIGRGGLTKSISSSNLRRTFNPEDSILLPGAFSSNSGPRFYGSTGSSKKLVINRDMRSDLFSTPSKVRDSGGADSLTDASLGSTRKLTKRVSFDTTIAKDSVPEGVNGNNGPASGSGSEPDMGYLRPQARPSNGTSSSSNTAGNGSSSALVVSPASNEPEMEQVTGKELAIVHEEEASPVRARCIPSNYRVNSKELGNYWMSPSKDEIEQMNRVQRQQVVNFTVGRTNVGQVRFRVPVDLTKINLDSIMDGIVTLIIRSATVYPDVNTKPPVGQGLNVPAEILLLHTCPRSGPDANAAKMKKHITRLKNIPDTTFVSYDEQTAAWVFRVEHFTTYGLDDDDDETDAETTRLSAAAGNAAPVPAYNTVLPSTEQVNDEDTFDFRRRKHVSVPGAFDDSHDIMDDEDEEGDVTFQQSFLSNRSADMNAQAVVPISTMEHDHDMEQGEDSGLYENEGEAPFSQQLYSAAELDDNNSLEPYPFLPDLPPVVQETPAGIMRARLRAIKESNTPLKLQVADGDNWMDMLQKTVSPQKRDRAALKALGEHGAPEKPSFNESIANFDKKAAASTAGRGFGANDNRGFATSIDLMNSLFEKAKAPTTQAPETIAPAKGFVKWPYKRANKTVDEDEATMDPTDRAFHDAARPIWSTDGACIVTEAQTDDTEPSLKRIRMFDPIGAQLTDYSVEGLSDHKDVVDVQVVDGVPAISTCRIPEIKAFAGFCEQVNQRRSASASTISQQLGSYEQSVWELASVLFDPIDEHASNPGDEARQRRANLATFWAQLVQDSSSAKPLDQAQSFEEKAVLYLASRKVPEACRALVDGKNFKLATLVSLIGTGDAFKKDMREQVDDWQQGDALSEFSVPLRSIYSLLAGNVAVCEGKKGGGVENRMNSVVVSNWFGLDWKQAFGLRLWYGIAAGEGIESAVAKYVEDLEQGRVPAPRPWYTTQRDITAAWADPQRELREDLLFGLLKVAAGLARLEDVLEPENSQPSPFRYRFCWQISQALSGAKHISASAKLSLEKADALCTSYASEVVHQNDRSSNGPDDGAWVHAIWVLLHLSDRTARIHAVQDVLARHTGSLFVNNGAQSNLYGKLVDDLKIPAQWVWQAAALYWRNQQNQPVLEAECLLRASAFADAHRIFVKELAPKAVVERNYSDIAEMLEKLQPHRQQIKDWALGGEVYSRFLDLLTLQRGGTLGGSGTGGSGGSAARRTRGRQQQQARDEAEQASAQLLGAVEALAASLPAMYDNAGNALPTEVAAITEMADVVAKETMALANKGRMDLTKISRLPLTEDRRVRYSSDLAFAYYREVMSAH
ncbi:nucleoporin nup189 [Sporothrix brasiliensis 5110]|uniref:Nucleoporin nup189 n=1 Tax=Sporothrix brasiliensis 5110 TaxID=1398154 RepID=A0A0C2F5L6_9PEZI|nr:nucleoporin nup189 [Sporothrix brasiliensis 5110]KIH94179.1 nucleoporin nup189 [Sporothrix brasiliensis 5110]